MKIDFTNTCDLNINVSLNEPSVDLSVETMFSDISFGIHKPWAHLNWNNISKLKILFSELEELMSKQ